MAVPRPIPGQIITRAKILDSNINKPVVVSPTMSTPDIDGGTIDDTAITGGSLSGTISGNPTLSGNPTFTGNVTHNTGDADFTNGIHVTRSSRSPIQYYDGDTPPASTSLYQNLGLSSHATGKGANAPTLKAFRGTIYHWAFVGTGATVEEVFFGFRIPHDFLMGSSPIIHISWSHIIGAPTGDVYWQIDASVARGDEHEAFDSPTSYAVAHTAGTQYYHHTTNFSLSAGQEARLEPDTVLLGRLYRDPAHVSDTFANDAYFLNVGLQYELGQVGTKENARPWTSIS